MADDIKAGTEGLSRQLRYQVIKFRTGGCTNCGQPRGASKFKRLCDVCGEVRKDRRRKKLGSKPWEKGSPGRPPFAAAQNEIP